MVWRNQRGQDPRGYLTLKLTQLIKRVIQIPKDQLRSNTTRAPIQDGWAEDIMKDLVTRFVRPRQRGIHWAQDSHFSLREFLQYSFHRSWVNLGNCCQIRRVVSDLCSRWCNQIAKD